MSIIPESHNSLDKPAGAGLVTAGRLLHEDMPLGSGTSGTPPHVAAMNLTIFRSIMFCMIGLTFLVDLFSGHFATGWLPLLIGLFLILCALSYFHPTAEAPDSRVWLHVVAYCAVITGIFALDGGSMSPFLYYNIIAGTTLIRGPRRGFVVFGLSTIAAFATYILVYSPNDPLSILHTGLMAWLGGGIFMILAANIATQAEASRRRSEELLHELDRAHNTLQEYARQLREYAATAEELAVTRERNRMAREIHDSLGHYLTAINIQLETGLELHEANPERAQRSVREAKRLASEALGDVRHSVAALRPAMLDGLSASRAVEKVADEFRSLTSIPITVRVDGDDRAATAAPHILFTLYRATQEMLTNIRKHAQASNVALRLIFTPDEARLIVQDDGVGLPKSAVSDEKPSTGFGLRGLQERAELLGGTFSISSGVSGGTRAELALPLPHDEK